MNKKRHNISAKREKQLEELIVALGVPCSNLQLLDDATTHRSYAAEYETADYERLEFFGDAVLKFVVAEYIFKKFAELHEGDLTEIAAVLVSAKTLEQIGNELELAQFIRVGRGVQVRGSIVARSMEALLGALYLDSEFKHVQPFIVDKICSMAEAVSKDSVKENYKAQLQQWTQARAQGTPTYAVVTVDGPAHDPIFEIGVSVANQLVAQGRGRSKKEAEQMAAKAAYEILSAGSQNAAE